MPRVPLPKTQNLVRYPWKKPPRILTKQKVLQISQDYYGRNRNCNRLARNRVEKGLQHAYRNRKIRTRNARQLWIQRVNAGARENGLQYAQLINGMKLCNIGLNRKMLADIAANEPLSFAGLCRHVRCRPEIEPKIYPAYGYIQSAVVTQKITKPTKHLGRGFVNAFLQHEHKTLGEILDHTTYRMPMYMDYVQIEKPTRVDMSQFYFQEARKQKKANEAQEKLTNKNNPDGFISSRDVGPEKARKHWKYYQHQSYENPTDV